MLSGKVHHLGDFGLGDLERIDPAYAYALVVHMQHYRCRLLAVLGEKVLQHEHHKFHWGVVIVQQQHLIEAGLLGFRPRLHGSHGGVGPTLVIDHLDLFNTINQNTLNNQTDVVLNASNGGSIDLGGGINAISSQSASMDHASGLPAMA